tara:strand:+ start:1081 stop:2229 length:1149 start_codon:yes stop_codon:yes gene_type:complete
MNIEALDIETTISNKGNFADSTNAVCFVGIGDRVWNLEYDGEPYGESLREIQAAIDETDMLLFVNAKFDLHWLRKYGIDISAVKVWDCSLVDFMLEAQTTPYPSMNKMAEKYKLAQKPDIKATYWENNICTKDIPKDEIVDYLMEHDLPTTKAIYEIQQEQVNKRSKAFQRLISLANQDLLVLEEMEYNGLYFDEAKCLVKAEEITIEITGLQQEIYDYHDIEGFNTASGDHLSSLLYGGRIIIPRKEVIGTYKTGARSGEDKYGWKDQTYDMPRLFNPLPRTSLKKEGYYKTGAEILKQLKSRNKFDKRLLECILSLAKLEKVVGTYYLGLPKLRETMNWEHSMLHGNLNQVTAVTGRLSSTKPNLQNIAGALKEVFTSRY